jgi:hypothetical protein
MRNWTMPAITAALLALPGAATAQATASVQAEATVLAPIAVADEQNLEFGELIPGFATTVAPADLGAGRFQLTGANELEVTLDFGSLPTTLSHTSSSSTLPISFAAGSAGVGVSDASVDATFDPSSAHQANLSGGALWVYIGGTVTPAVAQEAGDYVGTVTLSVAYTGT